VGETTPRTQAESRIATARAHPRPRKRNFRGTPDELVVILTLHPIFNPKCIQFTQKSPGKHSFRKICKISHNFPSVHPKNPQFGSNIIQFRPIFPKSLRA